MDLRIVPNSPTGQDPRPEPEKMKMEDEIWEAPFERWLRLADDLLRKWPDDKSAPPDHRA